MTEQYIVWALVVGIAVGAALYWFAVGQLPRRTDDQTPRERELEARWVSRTIEHRGGVAPADLVDEILELHGTYLAGPAIEVAPEEPVVITTPDDVALAAPATPPADEPRGS